MSAGWQLADLAPAIWVALAALALKWALGRWFDPLPGRVVALYLAAIAVLLGPALAGGRVLLPLDLLERTPPWAELDLERPAANAAVVDQLVEMTPWQAQVREAAAAGRWPLWNRLAAGGMPLVSNPQAQILQPLVVATWPLPLARAVGATAALRLLAAMVFTFLLLRRHRIGVGPAAAGGLAYGLSGAMTLWLGWPAANATALAPGVLWAVVLADQRGRRRDVALLAGLGWAVLISGHLESAVYALGLAAALAVARLVPRLRRRDLRGALAPAGRWVAAAALAGGMAAPLLAPTVDYLPQTERAWFVGEVAASVRRSGPLAGWRRPEGREVSRREMAGRLLGQIAPHAYGSTRRGRYWGPWSNHSDSIGFAGTAALLAALAVAIPVGRRASAGGSGASAGGGRLPGERFAAIGLLVLAATLVARPPPVPWLVAHLPVLRGSASLGYRAAELLPLLVAWLGAAGFERWRRGTLGRGRVAAAGAATVALVAWAYLGHPDPADPASLAELRNRTLALQLAVAAATAALLWLRPDRAAGIWRDGQGCWRIGSGWATAAMVLVVGGELAAIHRPANPALPEELYYPTTPAIDFLRDHLGGERMVAEGMVFPPNLPSIYGLADVRVYDPMRPIAQWRLTRSVSNPQPFGFQWARRPGAPVWDLLGVRYAMVRPGRRLSVSRRPVFRDEHVWIHARPGALPLLFLPASTRVYRGGDWVPRVLAIPDYSQRALVQRAPGHRRGWRARHPGAARLDLERPEPERFVAHARLVEQRLLASSVYQDGGWRLLLDRRPHPTLLANGPYLAAWLPAGDPRLDLLYRPRLLLSGVLAAALALAAAAAGLAGPRQPRDGRESPDLGPHPRFQA